MILKLLLNTRIMLMIFIKILKNTIQKRNVKYYLFYDDMIFGIINNNLSSCSNSST